jgi:hypothetical protein
MNSSKPSVVEVGADRDAAVPTAPEPTAAGQCHAALTQADPLKFNTEVITAPYVPDQHLVVYTVEPDSATARALPFLASWATAGTP